MKVEIGKLYRTRNGCKITILSDNVDGKFSFLAKTDDCPEGTLDCYSKSGEHWTHKTWDIIGPWEEPVTTLKVGQTYKTR